MKDGKEVKTPNKHIPKVSIGMPVYNGEKYIRKALDSLIAQTFTDFELIISDNASIDNTENICRTYAERDSRIRYIRQRKNIGMTANFQFVLDDAVGEYFMWASHDDEWCIFFVLKCVEMLLDNPKIGMAFTNIEGIDTYSRKYREMPSFAHFSGEDSFKTIFRFLIQPEYFGKANLFHSLFKRQLLQEVNNLDFQIIHSDRIAWGVDMCFNLGVLARGGMLVNDKVCFKKRYERTMDNPNEVNYVKIDFSKRTANIHSCLPIDYIKNSLIAVKGTKYYWFTFLVMMFRLIESLMVGTIPNLLRNPRNFYCKLKS